MTLNLDNFLSDDISVRVKQEPFKHVVMHNVFGSRFYELLCKEFNSRLDKGTSQKFAKDTFYKFAHYDAFCWTFNPEKDIAFSNVFYSLPWRHFINGFFRLKLTPNVLGEFHHHRTSSEGGYIHNDYDYASFTPNPLKNGLNPHFHECKYRGLAKDADHCVRSIAILYYFNNPKWEQGDGGETCLYTDYEAGSEPAREIAPVNNRLLAFEISPKSFHAFASNKGGIRNSMVMWYHSAVPYMVDRYGEEPK